MLWWQSRKFQFWPSQNHKKFVVGPKRHNIGFFTIYAWSSQWKHCAMLCPLKIPYLYIELGRVCLFFNQYPPPSMFREKFRLHKCMHNVTVILDSSTMGQAMETSIHENPQSISQHLRIFESKFFENTKIYKKFLTQPKHSLNF